MASRKGFEPLTYGLGNRCSILLSYRDGRFATPAPSMIRAAGVPGFLAAPILRRSGMRSRSPDRLPRLRPLRRRLGLAMLLGMMMAVTGARDGRSDSGGGAERLLGVASCDLVAGEGGVVTAVVDGDTVMLDGGLEVRLVGTQAPKLPLGRDGFVAWPLAAEAKAALERLALGKAVELRYGGTRRDRYGRALAQLFVVEEDGGETWLQEAMVGAGLARVYSFADNRQCVAALVAAERAARHSALGLWRDPYYLIRAATDPALAARHDSYDLVEGRVLSVGERGPIVYLDFGLEWSTDFTVVLGGEATAALAEAGWQVGDFKGRRIRVRGWVEQRGGPSIRVTHPEQIELLGGGE